MSFWAVNDGGLFREEYVFRNGLEIRVNLRKD